MADLADVELHDILSTMRHADASTIERCVDRLEDWMTKQHGPQWKDKAPSNDVF